MLGRYTKPTLETTSGQATGCLPSGVSGWLGIPPSSSPKLVSHILQHHLLCTMCNNKTNNFQIGGNKFLKLTKGYDQDNYLFLRKGGLLVNNVLVLAAGICLLIAKWVGTWELLIVGRLLIGINSGLNAGLAPMYLSEISPVALRGAVSNFPKKCALNMFVLLVTFMEMSKVREKLMHQILLFYLRKL
jgi:hypothetical protein